ncbi:MAG: hypothetical protein JO131_10080 [Gammaproteobacteria bacterium]|nr:hypothetical protein [Gammaproteobacteria bacterium]
MFAKPINDIQIAVDSLSAIKQAIIDILKTTLIGRKILILQNVFVKRMPHLAINKYTHPYHIIETKAERWKNRILSMII